MSNQFEMTCQELVNIRRSVVAIDALTDGPKFDGWQPKWVESGQQLAALRARVLHIRNRKFADPVHQRHTESEATEILTLEGLASGHIRADLTWATGSAPILEPPLELRTFAAAERAAKRLRRHVRLVPSRRRLLVQQTQRDLVLSEADPQQIELRGNHELKDIYADAVRSRTRMKAGAPLAPLVLGFAAALLVFSVAVGVDLTVHLQFNAQLLLQLAAAPIGALVVLAILAAAVTYIVGKYRIG